MKKCKKTAAAFLLIWSMILLSGCGGIVSSNNEETQIPKESSESVAGNQNSKTSEGNTEVSSSESESASESESETETESESESESASKPKPASESESESASKPKPASESESASKPNSSSESASKPGSSSKPESESASKPGSSSESDSNAPATQNEPVTPVTPEPAAPSEPEVPSINGVHLEMFGPVTQEEQNTASSIIASITNASMNEYQKVRAIHDYLVNHVTYSNDFDDDSVYTAQGAFNGSAVCQGYTDAFSLLCCYAGIQAEIVSGTADNGSGTGPQAHAWNLVRIDGVWYQVDTTWDDPVGAVVTNYDYFLTTDARMGRNHFADYYSHQYACTDDRYRAQHLAEALNMHADYYYSGITKHYVTNMAEVNAALASEQPVPGTAFVIYWHNELVSETITAQDIYNALSGCAYSASSQYVLDNYGNPTEAFVKLEF